MSKTVKTAQNIQLSYILNWKEGEN